jgi:pimeloyl-ACP methyl ester carboxylesterase
MKVLNWLIDQGYAGVNTMNRQLGIQIGLSLIVSVLLLPAQLSYSAGTREKIFVSSSIDRTEQPCYLILPEGFDKNGPPVPLLVCLHTWSGDVEQRQTDTESECGKRGWIFLFPNFRGPNNTPDGCGSLKAQQDILDAVDWVIERYPVDRKRVYLTGASGGGHMSMLMAGRYPERWTAVSAWVGISDLAAWHAKQAQSNYGKMLRACCGGAPGESDQIDRQYRDRSPITWLHRAVDVPLDLAAGVHDGHKGSVPIRQTLEAFNVVAKALGEPLIGEEEIVQLSRPNGRLDDPKPGDTVEDAVLGRAVYLRRNAGKARVTIFEGGHEGISAAALDWLSRWP